jgi:parallel beta-helix repeat protein
MADITAINGNTITIDTSRFTANGTNGGIKNAVSSGGYVLTDFALIKTIQTKAAENIVVENITLKAMSDISEPHIYTSSPISQTRQEMNVPQKNFRVYNGTVLDSANDGISIQGSGECEVIGCRVYNQKHKGIHWGTTLDMARIMNNFVYGCGSAQYEDASDYQGSGAMFFCSNNHRIIITGNHIENCYKGIFGFNYQGNGECDSNTIIANNTFKNCTVYGVILRDGIHAVLEANNFLGFGGTSIPVYVDNPNSQHLRNAVIANNTIGEWATATLNGDNEYNPAIKITGADGVVLTGNVVSVKKTSNSTPTVDASRCNIVVVSSNNMVITNNITEGSIDISDSGNTGIVKANNIEST